jgi:hypothetical protein
VAPRPFRICPRCPTAPARIARSLALRGKFALVRKAELGFDAALVASLGLPSGEDAMGEQGVSPGLALHAQLPFERP